MNPPGIAWQSTCKGERLASARLNEAPDLPGPRRRPISFYVVMNIVFSPLLVLQGIHHWTCVCFRGDFSQWKFQIPWPCVPRVALGWIQSRCKRFAARFQAKNPHKKAIDQQRKPAHGSRDHTKISIALHTHIIRTYVHTYIRTYRHTDIQTYRHTDIRIHYITLHYATLRYITLHHITSHYIT